MKTEPLNSIIEEVHEEMKKEFGYTYDYEKYDEVFVPMFAKEVLKKFIKKVLKEIDEEIWKHEKTAESFLNEGNTRAKEWHSGISEGLEIAKDLIKKAFEGMEK